MIALKRSNIFISFIFFSFITLWQTGLFWVGTTNNNFSVADNLSTQPLKYKEFTENTAPSESFISPPIPGDADDDGVPDADDSDDDNDGILDVDESVVRDWTSRTMLRSPIFYRVPRPVLLQRQKRPTITPSCPSFHQRI